MRVSKAISRRLGWLRSTLALLGLAVLLASCAGYAMKTEKLRADLAAGDLTSALASLEKTRGKGGLPYLMQRGLLQYETGDIAGAHESLAEASAAVEDLYTKSLSKEIFTWIVNDAVQAYQGEIFERVWIHYYRALAFLAQGNVDAAIVEGRAVTFNLRRFSDSGPDEAKYRNDPFLQYFGGLLYEADGELNDAWINYREAERLYGAEDIYGVSIPPPLVADLIRAGQRLGFRDLVAPYRQKYPEWAFPSSSEGEGELVLLVATGLMPPKRSDRIDFPIFKGTEKGKDNEAIFVTAEKSYVAWESGRTDLELAYILSIDLPKVGPSPKQPLVTWEIEGKRGDLHVASDLGALNRQCLADRYSMVMVRTIARGIVKYYAKQKMEQEQGKLAGFLTDIAGSATEVADTRCWSSLPAHIHVARIGLPAGTHAVKVNAGGKLLTGSAEVRPGRIAFLTLRAY